MLEKLANDPMSLSETEVYIRGYNVEYYWKKSEIVREKKIHQLLQTGSVMVERSTPEREVVSSNHSRVIPKSTGKK